MALSMRERQAITKEMAQRYRCAGKRERRRVLHPRLGLCVSVAHRATSVVVFMVPQPAASIRASSSSAAEPDMPGRLCTYVCM